MFIYVNLITIIWLKRCRSEKTLNGLSKNDATWDTKDSILFKYSVEWNYKNNFINSCFHKNKRRNLETHHINSITESRKSENNHCKSLFKKINKN